jgi:8-oxo-dGTP pyrophosphatase MutT (NUDIX family)
MSGALHVLYDIQKRLWRLFRPRTRGVKVMLFSPSGEIMLIRNSYGRSDLFVIPGGGIRPFENPEQAARREIKEELGCQLADLSLLSTHFTAVEGKRDTIYLFKATIVGEPRPDRGEVEEATFFRLADLPPTLSPASRRRIEEHNGARAVDGTW